MSVEVRDVAAGLWLWRQPHPGRPGGNDWDAQVSSFAVRSGGVDVLLDPLAPHPSVVSVWNRISKVDAIVILKPDHLRDVDLFTRWYGAQAHGPFRFGRVRRRRPSCSPSGPATSCPAGSSRSTTGAG